MAVDPDRMGWDGMGWTGVELEQDTQKFDWVIRSQGSFGKSGC